MAGKIVIEGDTPEELVHALVDIGIDPREYFPKPAVDDDNTKMSVMRTFIDSMYYGKRSDAVEAVCKLFPDVDITFAENYVARMFDEYFFGVEEKQ